MVRDVFISDGCIFGLKGDTKNEVFYQMTQKLFELGRIDDVSDFVKALNVRESEGPTGLGNEIAIPHGKSKTVKAATVIYGFHREGITYEALDDLPVKYFFMLAIPEHSNTEHLEILSSLARKLMHNEIVEQLKKASTGLEVLEIF